MFNKYPYTDFHELNLDWFLEEFKKYTGVVDSLSEKFDTLDETVQSFIDFVNSYFDNLDVSQEISDKLEQMKDNGDLLWPIINAFFRTSSTSITPIYIGDYVMDTNNAYTPSYYKFNHILQPSAICEIPGEGYLALNGVTSSSFRAGLMDTAKTNEGSYVLLDPNSTTFDYTDIAETSDREEIGHANSCCYVTASNKVVIAPVFQYDSAGAQSGWNVLLIYEWDSTNKVLINRTVISVPSDVGTVMAVSHDPQSTTSNSCYVYCYNQKIYSYDIDNDTFTLVKNIAGASYGYTFNQDFAVKGGTYYLSAPRGVLRMGSLSTSDNASYHDYLVDNVDSSGYRSLGEMEGMEFDSHGNLLNIRSNFVQYRVCDANVTVLPIDKVYDEPIANMYSLTNNTFKLQINKFRNDNTYVKHPAIINDIGRRYPVTILEISQSTATGNGYPRLVFYVPIKLVFTDDTPITIGSIEAQNGDVEIASSGTHDVVIDMSYSDCESRGTDAAKIKKRRLFFHNVRNGTLTFAGDGPIKLKCITYGITGDYGREFAVIDVGHDYALTKVRQLPEVIDSNSNSHYLQFDHDTLGVGPCDHIGLYVGSQRLAFKSEV